MKKLRLFQDKRKLKILAIRAMIYLIIIGAIVLLSSIIGRADSEYTLTADYICRYNNNTIVPDRSYDYVLSNAVEIELGDSFYSRFTSYCFFPMNNTGLTSFSITPSDFFNGSSGENWICFYVGYCDENGNIVRNYDQTSVIKIPYGESRTVNVNIPVNATKFILSIQKRVDAFVYTSYPVISYVPIVPPVPPTPPAPDEWQTLIEFIGYLLGSVVNVFNLTFSIESRLVWALVFGFPILNYVLDFFDEILDQIDASLPADHDLHKYRPDGYTPISYYDTHPYDNYSRWYYEHNGGFHW